MKRERNREIVWKGMYYQTMEYCCFRQNRDKLSIEGEIVGLIEEKPVHFSYQVIVDQNFNTQKVSICRNKEKTALYELKRLGKSWYNEKDQHLAEFDDCIDVDIAITPSTNTLPIRRVLFHLNVPQTLKMLYINPINRILEINVQVYTRLADNMYLYQSRDSDFKAQIQVDDYGIVVEYDGLYKRLSGIS